MWKWIRNYNFYRFCGLCYVCQQRRLLPRNVGSLSFFVPLGKNGSRIYGWLVNSTKGSLSVSVAITSSLWINTLVTKNTVSNSSVPTTNLPASLWLCKSPGDEMCSGFNERKKMWLFTVVSLKLVGFALSINMWGTQKLECHPHY